MGSIDRIRGGGDITQPVNPQWRIFEIREESARADSVTALDTQRQLMRQIIDHAQKFLDETDTGVSR